MIEKAKKIIIKNYLDLSMIAFPSAVEHMIIDDCFDDELPALNDFVNLKELVIKVPIFWEYISSLKIKSLTCLNFVIDDSGPVKTIEHDGLKKLKIYNISKKNLTPIEKIISANMLTGYDFSKMPMLEELCLDYFLGFDFNVSRFPAGLKKLEITNSEIKNVDWCLTVRNLYSINLNHNMISDIDLLSYMPNLNHISLQDNMIEDADRLYKIEGLKYLDISRNPIKNTEDIKTNYPSAIIITNKKDEELYKLKIKAENLSLETKDFIYNYDRFINNRSAFIQISNLNEQEKGYEYRLNKWLQDNFEYNFSHTNPFLYDYSEYSSDYKKSYLHYCSLSNSELEVKPWMKEELDKEINYEQNKIINCFDSAKGTVMLVSDSGLYKIRVTLNEGTGKLIFTNKISERLSNVLIRSAILTLCKSGQQKASTCYDYNIDVFNLYGNTLDSSISLGIVIAIFSLLNDIQIPLDTLIYGHLNTRGSLKKIEIKQNILPLLEKIGFKNIIAGKSTQKALNLIKSTMDLNLKLHCCNKLENILDLIKNI